MSSNTYQHRLHEVLQNYINKEYLDKKRVLFPLLDSNQKLTSKIDDYLHTTVEQSSLSDKTIAQVLETEYSEIYDSPTSAGTDINLPAFSEWRTRAERWYLDPLVSLRKEIKTELADLVDSVIVHGSLADHTAIRGWSDADIAIFLKENVVTNPADLRRLRRCVPQLRRHLYDVDPLQHHGFFVFPAESLDQYVESILPVVTFQEGAATLYGSHEFSITPVDCSSLMIEKFRQRSEFIKNLADTRDVPHDRYRWKGILSQILLLPTLFLQAKGEYIYKADSFNRAKQFVNEEWSVIEEATKVRRQWPTPPEPFYGLGKHSLTRYFFPGFPQYYQIVRDSYVHPDSVHTREFKQSLVEDAAQLVRSFENTLSEI